MDEIERPADVGFRGFISQQPSKDMAILRVEFIYEFGDDAKISATP
jgi:hypothetical protein